MHNVSRRQSARLKGNDITVRGFTLNAAYHKWYVLLFTLKFSIRRSKIGGLGIRTRECNMLKLNRLKVIIRERVVSDIY